MKLRLVVLSAVAFPACFSLVSLTDEEEKPAELADGDTVKVVEVVKGDELTVKKGKGKAVVRMLGVQAFSSVVEDEELQAFSDASVEFLKDSSLNKNVSLRLGKVQQDSHGRYLAYVTEGETDLNMAVVREGLAMVYTEYSSDNEGDYLDAELEARKAKKNIWASERASKMVSGLRRQWADFRTQRGDKGFVDPLLKAPTPPADPEPAEAPGGKPAEGQQ